MDDAMLSTPLDQRRIAAASVLPRGFYQRPTVDVARDLLGKLLVRSGRDGTVAVRVTEVEAYLGPDDPACHTFGGRRTPRVRSMWGAAGHAYVYMIYGVHHCLNLVTVGGGAGEAVLLRAAIPVMGHLVIRQRRGLQVAAGELCNGPGKLCQALAIDSDDDGHDLCAPRSQLTVHDDTFIAGENDVRRLPRIGVEYADEAAEWPLRFVLVTSSRRR
jgi:DNA-3-methyladenine glycosylase